MKKYDKYSPQVKVLLEEVMMKFGRQVVTPADFLDLSDDVFAKTRSTLGVSTLERLWGYVKCDTGVSTNTLDVLSCYADRKCFADFCQNLSKIGKEESEIFCGESLESASIETGQLIAISWPPNRDIVVKHLGGGKFVAVSAINSKIRVGDTFSCERFQLHWPLFVNDLQSEGGAFPQYVMGKEHGITRLQLLP